MTTTQMVAVLEAEIARLRQVRELLAGTAPRPERVPARARTAGGGTTKAGGSGKKRTLSPEARERIAAAQRARWAAHTKAKPGEQGDAAPKQKRGRPKKEAAAKKSASRNGGAPPEEGAEGTA